MEMRLGQFQAKIIDRISVPFGSRFIYSIFFAQIVFPYDFLSQLLRSISRFIQIQFSIRRYFDFHFNWFMNIEANDHQIELFDGGEQKLEKVLIEVIDCFVVVVLCGKANVMLAVFNIAWN